MQYCIEVLEGQIQTTNSKLRKDAEELAMQLHPLVKDNIYKLIDEEYCQAKALFDQHIKDIEDSNKYQLSYDLISSFQSILNKSKTEDAVKSKLLQAIQKYNEESSN